MNRKRVLIIDDEMSIRDAIQIVLNDYAFETETAANGSEGVERLKQQTFDLVIVDFGLPDIDGIEVLSEAQQLHPHAKYLMITTSPPPAQGPFKELTCLKKPFSIEDLLNSIRELLS